MEEDKTRASWKCRERPAEEINSVAKISSGKMAQEMDRSFTISVGNGRNAFFWNKEEVTFESLYDRLCKPLITAETVDQYKHMSKSARAEAKDHGGFMAGTLRGTHRRVDEVVSRSMITLDCDNLSRAFLENYCSNCDASDHSGDSSHADHTDHPAVSNVKYRSLLYTTHSHTAEHPRGRILFPTNRDMTPEECNAVSRYLANEIGMEMVDPCSFHINQLMYWPTVSKDGEYICKKYEGVLLNVDEYLARFPDWKDCTTLPYSDKEENPSVYSSGVGGNAGRKKLEDPLLKSGIVGDWCRTYSITDVMEQFLGDIYEPTSDPTRYRYKDSDSLPGVIVYDDKFAYSHHASDPACGRSLNSFDLVRIHLFPVDGDGERNEHKSFMQMSKFAANNPSVQEEALERKQEEAEKEFHVIDDNNPACSSDAFIENSREGKVGASDEARAYCKHKVDADDNKSSKPANSENQSKGKAADKDNSWKRKLTHREGRAEVESTIPNLVLIVENDKYLRNIVFNELADGMEIIGPVPWKPKQRFWRDADDAQLISYVEKAYGSFSQRAYDVAVTKVADDRSYHPIKQYLAALPKWDGTPRVDTLLIDYLGASDNAYTRAITRKTLCAAIRRLRKPGCKFDYMVVLNGKQGIGKSTLISKLGMEWYSDSLSVSDMNDKTAAEKLQGYWILEIGELNGMKKADLDKVKAFISRQDDKYRASFGRRVTPHPRQCVMFGTTNSENGYLRDITGNRRYWNVKVSGNGPHHSWELNQDTVDQIWAEALVIEQSGEQLYLPPELESYAQAEQREAMEQDDREGIVREYLDTLLPEDWEKMDLYNRRTYLNERDPVTGKIKANGTVRRMSVSNIEIWCECFEKNKADMKSIDSYSISAIMKRIGGWKKGASKRLPIYGRQRVYVRDE